MRKLTPDEQVLLYNAVSVAERYTKGLPDTSTVKQEVRDAVEVCLSKGFPYKGDGE